MTNFLRTLLSRAKKRRTARHVRTFNDQTTTAQLICVLWGALIAPGIVSLSPPLLRIRLVFLSPSLDPPHLLQTNLQRRERYWRRGIKPLSDMSQEPRSLNPKERVWPFRGEDHLLSKDFFFFFSRSWSSDLSEKMCPFFLPLPM